MIPLFSWYSFHLLAFCRQVQEPSSLWDRGRNVVCDMKAIPEMPKRRIPMRTGQLPAIINHIGAKSVADLRMAETRGLEGLELKGSYLLGAFLIRGTVG